MRIVKLLCVNSPSILERGAYRLILRAFDAHNHFRNLSE